MWQLWKYKIVTEQCPWVYRDQVAILMLRRWVQAVQYMDISSLPGYDALRLPGATFFYASDAALLDQPLVLHHSAQAEPEILLIISIT